MHCIQCAHATNVGVPGRQPLYLSMKGLHVMLRWLLELELELTPFHGHLIVLTEGVRDAQS